MGKKQKNIMVEAVMVGAALLTEYIEMLKEFRAVPRIFPYLMR